MRLTRAWAAFVIVHAALVWLCLVAPGWPLGDVERVYRFWAEGAASGSFYVGISTGFVYPILAFLPIFAALALGPGLYAIVWLGLVTALNAAAFAVLLGRARSRRRVSAGWWWLGFLLLLGPIALARIDSVSVPLVIVAVLWLRARPLWSTVLLTIATWVKVWPAAVIAALFVAAPRRWRIAGTAAGTSLVIAIGALLLGSGPNVFSFITEQAARGIQIEAPVATPWMWQAVFGSPGSQIYYDEQILTFQVTGTGTDVAAALMTPLLAIVVLAVLLLGWRALRQRASMHRLLPPLVLALVTTMIAFNKVGSPQFISWLVAPVILGLVAHGKGWRTPAVLVAVLAVLTQLVYPYLYGWLLAADPLLVLVLTLRNLLEFVLLGWAGWSIVRSGRSTSPPYRGSVEPGQRRSE